MRPTCVDCALKHLSQASILLQESKQGYPKHLHYARGHMAEAESELISRYPKHAELVRAERKKLEESEDYKPDFDKLIDKVDQECDVCQLQGNAHSKGNPRSRAFLPHNLTEAEKASPELRRKLARCIKKTEIKCCGKVTPHYENCSCNPVAVCRTSVRV